MMSSECLHLSDVEPGAAKRDRAGRAARTVQEAQTEMDRLLTSLAEDGELPDDGALLSEEYEPVPAARWQQGTSVYLIISNKAALQGMYGRSGFEQLHTDLRELQQAVEARTELEAVLAYVDDEQSLAAFGVRPADPTNPWQVKRVVDGIDGRLAERGGQVRYVLIVGGDGVIPFHRLPNPVDDQDSDVPSDNPYACRDTGHIIPERAIGRMPDGGNGDIRYLERLIWTAVEAHQRRAVSKGLLSTLSVALGKIRGAGERDGGMGYSASIWRKASRAVFRLIGDDRRLRTSPPLTYEGFEVLDPPHFSYFNLHGVEDGPNWYGQRDALFPADYPLFPLALRPHDPSIEEHRNAVVFTEACYGANILGKTEKESIALRLLAAGALAVVGSTKVSYGSIAPPLLGADLVGRYFWEGLRDRLTIGDALRHAKVSMADDMQERQGYLDDEDQKALISFVLYGDPALSISFLPGGRSVRTADDLFCPPIICSRKTGIQRGMATDEMVASVKARVETSLPHMSHASVRAKPLAVCTGTCEKGCGLAGKRGESSGCFSPESKGFDRGGPGWALTLRKDISISGDGAHHQVVKVVVDESGHIRKMVMSK